MRWIIAKACRNSGPGDAASATLEFGGNAAKMPARDVRIRKPVGGVVKMQPFANAGQGSMRVAALVLFSIVPGANVALTQGEPAPSQRAGGSQETPEEVIVRGRRLTDLRFEIQVAREQAYAIFNEINSNDEFDIYCRDEGRTGTRATQRVCRAQFEGRVSADAAKEYMAHLFLRCPQGINSGCIFSETSSGAISAAQGVEGQALSKRDQLKEEILRLAHQDDRFAQAILDFYEASQRYDEERQRSRERTRER